MSSAEAVSVMSSAAVVSHGPRMVPKGKSVESMGSSMVVVVVVAADVVVVVGGLGSWVVGAEAAGSGFGSSLKLSKTQ